MTKTVVLVTGSNQGIGYEIVKKLATEHGDYQLVLSGRRKAAVDEAVAGLRAAGLGNVDALVLDISDDASIAAAVAAVQTRYGRLDVLVNNAGVIATPAVDGESRAEWATTLSTNVASVALVTDAFLPLLRQSVGSRGPKRIVFLSSSMGSLARKAEPDSWMHANRTRAYATSKAALNMLAWHYAVAFEQDTANWKINCVCPGYCATQLNGFQGDNTVASGAVRAAELATLGADGPTATFSNKEGSIPW